MLVSIDMEIETLYGIVTTTTELSLFVNHLILFELRYFTRISKEILPEF